MDHRMTTALIMTSVGRRGLVGRAFVCCVSPWMKWSFGRRLSWMRLCKRLPPPPP